MEDVLNWLSIKIRVEWPLVTMELANYSNMSSV